MRIISNFHDYYDCMQKTDEDRSLIYNRKSEEIISKDWPFPTVYSNYNIFNHSFDLLIIGFCGKIYPKFQFYKPSIIYGEKSSYYLLSTFNEIDSFLRENTKKRYLKSYDSFGKKEIKKDIDNLYKQTDNYKEIFIEKKCPIFVAKYGKNDYSLPYTHWGNRHSILWNAPLTGYSFEKIFNPAQAYQEISMFLNNIAWPDKPMLQLSNEDMAASKGHGDKYSFRKAPSQRH